MGVNNQELDINIDTYPITLNYNSNDLNENKTGFLPVNISVSNPNFVQLYADKYWPNTNPEVPDDQPNNHIFNQPIEFNGKYKFIPFESPPGSFPVAGYIPQYMNDQNATNWDLNINIPQTLVNNYTPPTITTNGTYTIPSGYTGFNNFTVSTKITLNSIAPTATDTISDIIYFNSFTRNTTTGNLNITIPPNTIYVYIYFGSTYYSIGVKWNNTSEDKTALLGLNERYKIIEKNVSGGWLLDNNNEKVCLINDEPGQDGYYTRVSFSKSMFQVNTN